jgi:hypothetical protein
MDTTTLSLGASLLASGLTLLIYIQDLNSGQKSLLIIFIVVGFLLLIHGTGLLREKIISPILRKWKIKYPQIAIISDLPWDSSKRTFAWAWSEMKAENWQIKLQNEANKLVNKPKIALIKMRNYWTRYFIERYNVLINPYGSVYPEINIKELTIWNTFSTYVLHGGMIVSLADIPFYYAYDELKKIAYDLIGPAQLIPMEYKKDGDFFRVTPNSLQPVGSFSGTPFLNETHVSIRNIEIRLPSGTLKSNTLQLKEKNPLSDITEVENVVVNRGFRVEHDDDSARTSNIHSIVKEIKVGSEYYTPFCYIDYGKGRYLVSTLFLDYQLQSNEVREKITELEISLVLQEIHN